MRFCPNCKAELFAESDECFGCGMIFEEEKISPLQEKTELLLSLGEHDASKIQWQVTSLAAGLTIASRFSILRKEKITNHWVLYRVIDQEEGIERWLQVSNQPSLLHLRVIQAAEKLHNHHHLFPLLQVGLEPWPYMILDRVVGQPLSKMLEGLTEKKVYLIIHGVTGAIQAIHQAGLANIDLQLESIWLSEDGFCKLHLSDVHALHTEVLAGRDILKAVGLMYWLLSGGQPYSPQQSLSFLSPRGARLIRRAMSKEFTTAAPFLHELFSILSPQAFFPLAEQQLERLRIDAYEDVVLCGGKELPIDSVAELISKRQVIASSYLREGWLLLQSDPLCLFEAGYVAAQDQASLLLEEAWRRGEKVDVSNILQDKAAEHARVYFFLGKKEEGRKKLQQAQEEANSTEDWLQIAQVAFYPFADQEAFQMALDLAKKSVVSVEDGVKAASFCFWTGQGDVEELLAQARAKAHTAEEWLRIAENDIGILDDSPARSLDNFHHCALSLAIDDRYALYDDAFHRLGKQDCLMQWAEATDELSLVEKIQRFSFAQRRSLDLLVERLQEELKHLQIQLQGRLESIGVVHSHQPVEELVQLQEFVHFQEQLAATIKELDQTRHKEGLPIYEWSTPYVQSEIEIVHHELIEHRQHKQQQRIFAFGIIVLLSLILGYFWVF